MHNFDFDDPVVFVVGACVVSAVMFSVPKSCTRGGFGNEMISSSVDFS